MTTCMHSTVCPSIHPSIHPGHAFVSAIGYRAMQVQNWCRRQLTFEPLTAKKGQSVHIPGIPFQSELTLVCQTATDYTYSVSLILSESQQLAGA